MRPHRASPIPARGAGSSTSKGHERLRRRAGFTLLELLVATVLASVLVLVLAAAFSYASRAYEGSLRRIDQARDVQTALERLEADWARAVPVAWLRDFFVVEEGRANDPELGAQRRDALHLLVLESEDQAALVRIRWRLEPVPGSPRGLARLVRERTPVPAAELGPCAALGWDEATRGPARSESQALLERVVQLRLRPFEGSAFVDAGPAPAPPADRSARYVYQGQDASIEGFELRTPGLELLRLAPGALIRLRDARSQDPAAARFDVGLYALRLREAPLGPPLVGRAALRTPPGDAPGQVAYQAAFLPPALHAALELWGEDEAPRRFDRVLALRASQEELLLGAGE